MRKNIPELNQKQGKMLKYVRKRKNLTQEKLAELSNYSVQHISYLENGSRKISYEAAAIFAEILDVTPSVILGGTDFIPSGRNTDIQLHTIHTMFECVLKIMFKYGYDLIGFIYPTVTEKYQDTQRWSESRKIENIAKSCINNHISDDFVVEFIDRQETTHDFLFVISTPDGSSVKISPEQVYNSISNIIQYAQLRFLDFGNADILGSLAPIKRVAANDCSILYDNKSIEKHRSQRTPPQPRTKSPSKKGNTDHVL